MKEDFPLKEMGLEEAITNLVETVSQIEEVIGRGADVAVPTVCSSPDKIRGAITRIQELTERLKGVHSVLRLL